MKREAMVLATLLCLGLSCRAHDGAGRGGGAEGQPKKVEPPAKKAAGARCGAAGACAAGLVCRPVAGGAKACAARGKAGAPCAVTSHCQRGLTCAVGESAVGRCERAPREVLAWIARLRDPAHAAEAVKRLRKTGHRAAVLPLCRHFRDHPSPAVLEAVISFRDRRAIPTLRRALRAYKQRYHSASLAARALAELGAKEAIPELVRVAVTPLSLRSRANKARVDAIDALGRLGGTRAVDALVKVVEGQPRLQDFYLNKRACVALGRLKAARAVPALIRALFRRSTIQGTTFPMARVALVRIGAPAVAPLITALKGKDAALEALAQQLKLRRGAVLRKTALVLGDLRAGRALLTLLARLRRAKPTWQEASALVEAVGKIGDRLATRQLIKLLRDRRAEFRLRMACCSALTALGDKRALPALLQVARKGQIKGGFNNLQEAAAMAYGRIVGAEVRRGYPRIKALHKRASGTFKNTLAEVLARMELARVCKDDVLCYGGKLVDARTSLAQKEKAAIMIGILPHGRKALSQLVRALPTREPILRLFLLEAAKRIGVAADKALIAALEKLAAQDRKRRARFLGADLATADEMALAVIGRR